jgi:metallophosphoesterase superfamily enzyme
MEIEFGGKKLVLLPEKALLIPEANALVLSDVHLGKSATFRENGLSVPDAVFEDDLNRLDDLVNKHGADLYVVGDLVHSTFNHEWQRFADRRATWTNHVVLVAGNHDFYAIKREAELGIQIVPSFDLGGIKLIHNPHVGEEFQVPKSRPTEKNNGAKILGDKRFVLEDEGPRICGHLHPALVLRGNAHMQARVACFFMTNNTLILPAFGRFTGSYRISPKKEDRVFLPLEKDVLEVAPSRAK